MPNPFLYKWTVVFQIIQFSISKLFQTIQFSISKLFNAESIFIQMNSCISNNSVKHEYTVELSKTFLFQTIQFSQTVLIQTIQLSISIVFVYTQLNVKNSSISNNSV